MARPLAVAQHLDFDVPRLLQIFFEIDRVVAERGLRLAARGRQRVAEFFFAVSATFMPRPPPPAAALISTGKPILRAASMAPRCRPHAAIRAGHDRDAEANGGSLGFDLVAHDADVLGLRPDEMHVVFARGFRRSAHSRTGSRSRMHRIGAGDLAGGEQGRNVEIAFLRAAAGRCTRFRRRAAHASRRRRRWNAPPRSGCRVPCARAARAARSRRGWLSRIFSNMDPARCHSTMIRRFPEFDRLAVLEQDLEHGACARRRDLVHRLHRFDDQQRIADFYSPLLREERSVDAGVFAPGLWRPLCSGMGPRRPSRIEASDAWDDGQGGSFRSTRSHQGPSRTIRGA